MQHRCCSAKSLTAVNSIVTVIEQRQSREHVNDVTLNVTSNTTMVSLPASQSAWKACKLPDGA